MRADGRRQRGKGHRKGNNPERRCKGNNTGDTHTGASERKQLYPLVFSLTAKETASRQPMYPQGEFLIYETAEPIEDEFSRFEPKEILYPDSLRQNIHYSEFPRLYSTAYEDWALTMQKRRYLFLTFQSPSSLDGLRDAWLSAAISAAGAFLN